MATQLAQSRPAWWTYKDSATARQTMQDTLSEMETRQKYRRAANLYNLRLYGGTDWIGGNNYALSKNPWGMSRGRLTFNMVQSVVDTATAKIAKNKPRPKFLTSGGNWEQKKKAQNLTKFVDGEFYRMRVPKVAPFCFRHACIFGTGFAHVFQQDKKVALEWVFPDELKVDEDEAVYGQPRTMYRIKIIDKAVLIATYPEFEDEIRNAPQPKESDWLYYRNPSLTTVTEAWHLPSRPWDDGEEAAEDAPEAELAAEDDAPPSDGCDGRHTISIEGATLVDEHYHRNEFPFIKLCWTEPVLGYWGSGLSYILTPLQVDLNKTLGRFQDCMHLASVTRVWVPVGSGVAVSAMGNMPAAVHEFAGSTAPVIDNRDAVPREIMEHAQWCIQSGYQLAGISEMSAQGEKPQGLDSGKALREFDDIGSERFIIQGQQWEEFHLEIARHIIWNAADIARREGDYETQAPDKKKFHVVKWSDIDLSEEEYVMQLFPTSSLSQTPAGRLSDVNDMMQMGLIKDNAQAQELLAFPDLESEFNIELADRKDIERTVEKILQDGDYMAPDAMQNLAFGVKRMTLAYLEAKDDNAPQANLNKALQWISAAKDLLQPPAPPAPIGGASGPPAPPPGQPMPMPPGGPMPPPMPGPQGPPPGTPLA